MTEIKRKNRWNTLSDIEVLTLLKDEIERIGISDYPSKTKFNELYNPDNCMSASMYCYRFNKTWKELMEFIGLDYDKTSMARKRGALGKGVPRREYKTKWRAMSDDEMLDVIESELNRLAIRGKQEYADMRDKEIAPSTNTIMTRFGSWSSALNRIEERKNEGK